MKRLIILSIQLLFFGILSTNAQVKGFVGVKGGAQLSNAYIEHTIYNTFMNTTFVPGYNSQLLFKLFTSRATVGLQTGIGLEQKGWKQIFETDEPSYDVSMSYLVLPIEAVGYTGNGKTKAFATLGMYLENLVKVEKDSVPNLNNIGSGVEFYTYEPGRDRKFGYGVRVSLGIQREFSFGTLHLDGFITYSISSFIRSENLRETLPDLSNHYAAGFSIGYLMPFGKKQF